MNVRVECPDGIASNTRVYCLDTGEDITARLGIERVRVDLVPGEAARAQLDLAFICITGLVANGTVFAKHPNGSYSALKSIEWMDGERLELSQPPIPGPPIAG